MPTPPGRTHIIEEGAGVDEMLRPWASVLCTQAVQHVRHGAHDAHQHLPLLWKKPLRKRWQLSTEQASLLWGGH